MKHASRIRTLCFMASAALLLSGAVRAQSILSGNAVQFGGPGRSNATCVAVADINGDGHLDVLLGEEDGASLWLNDGYGGLSLGTWNPTGMNVLSIAVGDIDNDGDVDVAVGTGLYNRWYENTDGSLGNTPAWESQFPSVTNGIGLGDVDGDGDLDLVCANGYTSTGIGTANHVYRNDGGTFTTQPAWTQTDTARLSVAVALGDVNGDGRIDAVFGNRVGANRLYLGDAAGLLAASAAWEDTDALSTRALALGDISGDGILDLVCGNWTVAANLYRGDGAAFSTTADWRVSAPVIAQSAGVALGDLNFDGTLDIALARQTEEQVYLNRAGAPDTLRSWQSSVASAKRGVALADLNGDGGLELIAVGDYLSAHDPRPEVLQGAVYENRSLAYADTPDWLTSVDRNASDLELADLDDDGYLDLFISHPGAASEAWYFNGVDYGTTPGWRNQEGYSTVGQYGYPTTSDAALADMDDDGDPDLLLANGLYWKEQVYRNDGGVFEDSAITSFNVADLTTDIGYVGKCLWGDFSGDGFPDPVFSLAGSNNGEMRFPNTTGIPVWTLAWESVPCHMLSSIHALDVDDDGDLDLVAVGNEFVATESDAVCFGLEGVTAVFVHRNSNGVLNNYATASIMSTDGPAAPGYFNDDAYIDLLVVNGNGSILMVNSGGNFVEDPTWAPTTTQHIKAVSADVDGDGYSDAIVTRGTYTDIFFSDHGRLANSPRSVPTGMGAAHIAPGDIDADGDVDIVVATTGSPTGGRTRLYLSRRMPVFKGDFAAPASQLPANPVVIGDVEITPVDPGVSNTYDVRFVLYDVESDPAHVTLEYQYEGEGIWRPMATGGIPATLASSPGGTVHSFSWNVIEVEFTSRPIVARLQATDVGGAVGASAQHVSRVLRTVGTVKPHRPWMIVPTPVVAFPTVTVGDTVSAQVVIRNAGNEELVIQGVVLPSADLTIGGIAPSSLAPGERDTLEVLFHPVNVVSAPGDIEIQNNDPTRPTVSVPVSVDVRALKATSDVLWSEPELPIDQDVTVVVTPLPKVHVESGYLFHRATGAAAFTDSIPLVASRDGFIAVVRREALVESGFDYFIRLDNSGVHGTDPETGFYHRDVSAPTTVRAVPVPNDGTRYAQGVPVVVQAQLPPGSVFQRGWVYYREGATADYDTVAMVGSGDVAEGKVPGTVADLRGIDFWLGVETLGATLTAPALDPQNNPYAVQITLADVRDSATHPGMTFRLMSFPADVLGTAQGALGDDLGSADDTQWRLFSYPGPTGKLYGEIEDIPRFEQGKAYWLITRDAYRLDTAPEVSLSTNTATPFERKLDPGWNLVGNPFPFDVAWSDVIRDTMAVPGPPKRYRGQEAPNQYADATILEPFSGYWVHNDADSVVSVWIPPVEHTGPVTPTPDVPLTWGIDVTAARGDDTRGLLRLGCSERAKDARDERDRLLPPLAPESSMDLYAVGEQGQWLSRDARTASMMPGWGHAWSFDVAVAKDGRVPVTLRFAFDAVPEGAEVLLLDREVKRTHDLSDGASVEVYVAGSARKTSPDETRFVLLVGDAQYIEEHRSLLPGLPTKTALHQNFPNPFNPTTVIRYELARPGRVSLKIYDVRGALVRTLVDGDKAASRYEVGWDGVDNRGSRVASGIYFYRLLSSEGVVLTRKMVLLK